MTLKKAALEQIILALLEKKETQSLQQIAEEAGIGIEEAKNRRALQRALVSLAEQERIEALGAARARVYRLKDPISRLPLTIESSLFHDIVLSESSTNLLKYILKPLRSRSPVGYNQDFLKSYIPNQTVYLSSSLREELFSVGKVEPVVRPAGTYARAILNRLLIDLSWNSSRLEGNTYSLLETKRLIELGENAVGKDATEAQMIRNQ